MNTTWLTEIVKIAQANDYRVVVGKEVVSVYSGFILHGKPHEVFKMLRGLTGCNIIEPEINDGYWETVLSALKGEEDYIEYDKHGCTFYIEGYRYSYREVIR